MEPTNPSPSGEGQGRGPFPHDPLRGALARVVRAQKLDPNRPEPACAFGVYVGKRLDHIEDLCTWILRTLLAGVIIETVSKFLH